ncbi:uncharacterized protein LOC124403814 [Silurus meridionalis]|uniref:uncharacterized protein LOC124403814 n=1 Tax=Silurus meridionalis TaxID=175797 RepID=UPI001EEB5438|nr:uncharacterized protein LOC124403814 [Silurus meridionalis]
MDFPRSRDACVLNTDEASLIETAVRAAVMSVLKVFCEVSEKRSHRYEVKLAAAERENAALRSRLESAEQELQTLHQISSNYNISTEVTLSHDFIPEHTRETVEEPTCFHSDTSLMIKQEEHVSEDTLCSKSELTDETFAEDQCDHPVIYNTQTNKQTPGAQMWNMQQHLQTFSSPKSSLHQSSEKWIPGDDRRGKSKSRECVRRYRERIRADPEKYLAWKEKERSRSFRRRKRIQDLPEPMQKLQREAWREATRRHRARKMEQATSAPTDTNRTLNP